MLWMVGAPLVSLVKSVASGAGSIASGVAKGVGNAVSGADEEQTAKVAASGAPAGGNGGNAVIGEESSVSEMFGGLDLTKVKSALEDEGPMGPEEEGPKTVYKQMIKQLQNISSTLLRMEESLRMLLSIEYERIQGMVRQDRDTTLKKGDTDENKKGLLGRATGGVGDMLGGAYSKVKGGLSGTFGKLLGLGALIFAFKNQNVSQYTYTRILG